MVPLCPACGLAAASGEPLTRKREGSRQAAPGASITQGSLLPPPWLELTTSEPLTSAVRVRPPGSTQLDRPLTTYGRKSTCRGAKPSSVQVGQADSVTTGWAM